MARITDNTSHGPSALFCYSRMLYHSIMYSSMYLNIQQACLVYADLDSIRLTDPSTIYISNILSSPCPRAWCSQLHTLRSFHPCSIYHPPLLLLLLALSPRLLSNTAGVVLGQTQPRLMDFVGFVMVRFRWMRTEMAAESGPFGYLAVTPVSVMRFTSEERDTYIQFYQSHPVKDCIPCEHLLA